MRFWQMVDGQYRAMVWRDDFGLWRWELYLKDEGLIAQGWSTTRLEAMRCAAVARDADQQGCLREVMFDFQA